MKKNLVVTVLLAMLIFSAIVLSYSFNKKGYVLQIPKKVENTGFAIVELFTSEGCSSCPAADAAIARLLARSIPNVYILSFHVDYWNKLGWKDPFSQSLFTERQNKYAQYFSSESIYTPQVVVNGTVEFVGSNENKLNTSVERALQDEKKSAISIKTIRDNKTVTVSYDSIGSNVLLNLAIVQPAATILVKRGENVGKTLQHVNIVRVFQTINAKEKGQLTMEIPTELMNIPIQLIAYIQSRDNFNISGAVLKNL